jgi:xanthine dehydrogenase accessory factor
MGVAAVHAFGPRLLGRGTTLRRSGKVACPERKPWQGRVKGKSQVDKLYESILQSRQRGEEAVVATVVETEGSTPARVGAKLLVRSDGTTVGTVGGGELETAVIARAQQLIAQRQGTLVRYTLTEDDHAVEGEVTGMLCGGNVTIFFDYIGRGARAYIYGAGHVGRALAQTLSGLGYYITVIDNRAEMADDVPGADRTLIADFVTALDDEYVAEGAYFLIATPSHDDDYATLRRVMASDWEPIYVGMLGSVQKSSTMRQRLRSDLGDDAPWHVLYTPVGLDVGGSTPAEIAISIASEMQAIRYGKNGHRHMRLTD